MTTSFFNEVIERAPGSWTKQLCICRELHRRRMRTKSSLPLTRIASASWPIPRTAALFRLAVRSAGVCCPGWPLATAKPRTRVRKTGACQAVHSQLGRLGKPAERIQRCDAQLEASRMPLTPKKWCVLEAEGELRKLSLAMSSATCRIRRKAAGFDRDRRVKKSGEGAKVSCCALACTARCATRCATHGQPRSRLAAPFAWDEPAHCEPCCHAHKQLALQEAVLHRACQRSARLDIQARPERVRFLICKRHTEMLTVPTMRKASADAVFAPILRQSRPSLAGFALLVALLVAPTGASISFEFRSVRRRMHLDVELRLAEIRPLAKELVVASFHDVHLRKKHAMLASTSSQTGDHIRSSFLRKLAVED